MHIQELATIPSIVQVPKSTFHNTIPIAHTLPLQQETMHTPYNIPPTTID